MLCLVMADLPHGLYELNNCINHLSIHPNILFTMTESNGHLPFLDIDIYGRPDVSLGHTVYKKPTHTNLYLNIGLHHHPANKHSVPATLAHQVRTICNQKSFPGELEFLHSMSKQNGYSDRQIHCALNPPHWEDTAIEDLTLVAFLSFVGLTLNHISRC